MKKRIVKDNRVFKYGDKFGKWTVIKENPLPDQSAKHYLCKCECGNEYTIISQSLKEKRSTQCVECYRNSSHGMVNTRTYRIWAGVLQRCYNKKHRVYRWYGAKGIVADPRWNKFENFFEDMGVCPDKYEIDRINPLGNYEKSNCRWVTKEVNLQNRAPLKDTMPGKVFYQWTVIKKVDHKPTHWYYLCKCKCGTEKIIAGGELRRGKAKRCRSCAPLYRKKKYDFKKRRDAGAKT